MTDLDPRQELFDQLDGRTLGPRWLVPIRKAAVARFADAGFPSTKDEDWRFTNVDKIKDLAFKLQFEAPPMVDVPSLSSVSHLGSLDSHRLVFVDGVYAPDLSDPIVADDGVTVCDMKHAFEIDPLHLQEHVTRYSQHDQNAFTALNTAYFSEGAVICLKRNAVASKPIHLVFLATGAEEGITTHPRNLVTVESGASVTLVEEYVSLGGGAPTFTNAVSEFEVGDNAYVEHIKIQDEAIESFHVAGIYARLGRDCRFRSHSLALGAAISRNNIRTRLNGPGLECVLNGLYLTKGNQVADHHMIVDHAEPHCDSHEYFNGILDDQSRGVFHGRILVRPHAQKTDAKQTNKNLLLSDDATANTKPQLEIYADDVKCTHGATIGQMDEEAIFYLRARGVPHAVARQMLMHAFAGEITDRIEFEAIRECLDRTVWDRLEKERKED